MKKLRVGIAGYGVVGKRRRIFIDQQPNFKTVAVSDVTFDGSGTMPDGTHFYDSYQGLINHDLDVLFVSLPNNLAPQATIQGLDRGMHVFCEKPPGRNVKDIEDVIAKERQKPDLKLKYGFNHRYHHSIIDARRIIESGELGTVLNLVGVYGKSHVVRFEKGWRAERERAGGGILLDQGIHMVDLMRLFTGDFSHFHSFISNDYWHHDVEDNAYALMRTAKGQVAMLHSSATRWQHGFKLEIHLTEGFLTLRGFLSGSKSYGEETLTIGRRVESDTGTPRSELVRYLEDPSWQAEVAEFANCIAMNKPVVEGSSSEALKTMQHVYRIYCADQEWKNRFFLE